MGLDMYLYAEKFIGKHDYKTVNGEMTKELNPIYQAVNQEAGMTSLPTPDFGSMTVSKCVGYWRKANAIHGWFVRELANGVDECQRINVGREDLIKLRDHAVNALANRSEAVPNVETTKAINLDENADSTRVIGEIMSEWANQMLNKKTAQDTNTIVLDPLEPTAGFFFGSTEKDEWYYKDLEYTVDVINSLLANNDQEVEYYYRASW